MKVLFYTIIKLFLVTSLIVFSYSNTVSKTAIQ